MNINCVDLKRQQLLDVLVNNGVDLEDPNAFIIDEFEGVTGDWFNVSEIIDYLEDGEVEEFGIDQQGFAAKRLKVKRVNDAFIYSLFDEDDQPLHDTVQEIRNTDMIDIDDTTDDEEDENGNPIPQPTEHDCTVTIDEGKYYPNDGEYRFDYHVYQLGSFTLDESERLLQAISELPIVRDEMTERHFNQLEWEWNEHDWNCTDLLAATELFGLIVDYTFKLK